LGYRKALFLYDLAGEDCEKLMHNRRGRLSTEVLEHRLALADEVIALLITELARQRAYHSNR
jgi:hypothetical protein